MSAVLENREAPGLRARFACALLIALITGGFTYWTLWDLGSTLFPSGSTIQAGDFTYSWLAGRAVAEGVDPYEFVRTQKTPGGGGWFYAYPAALIALPFGWLPARLAGTVFIGVGCGLLAFFISRDGLWRLAIFLTAPAMRAYQAVQWSPLLLAGAVWPGLLGIVASKPNIAPAFFAYQTNRRDILRGLIGVAALVIVSFILAPSWPIDWIHTLSTDEKVAQYKAPILTLLGLPIALAALRWRRREARLLLVMGCLPQNSFFYEQLPLMLVPANLVEMLSLAVLSQIGHALGMAAGDRGMGAAVRSGTYFPFMIATLYLPCLVMVLRRANEGPAPAWLERRLDVLPAWLRGRQASPTAASK